MVLGSYDSSARYRRRSRERSQRTMLILLLLIIASAVGYWLGGARQRSHVNSLETQVNRHAETKAGLEKQITENRAALQTSKVRYEQLLERYQAEVPAGELKTLTDLVRRRLEEGTSPDRLAFVIQSARPPRDCLAAESKRFVVQTPVYRGPKSYVSVGNGVITVAGTGDSAINAESKPEAWYDPGKPVTVRFTQLGGEDIVKTDTLPIHHSIIAGDREYRFTIAAGERSFARVTFDSCSYP